MTFPKRPVSPPIVDRVGFSAPRATARLLPYNAVTRMPISDEAVATLHYRHLDQDRTMTYPELISASRSGRTGLRAVRLVWFALCLMIAHGAQAQGLDRLQRVEIDRHGSYTRIAFKLDDHCTYSLLQLPDRLRLTLNGADSPRFRRLKAYSDQHIGGIAFSQHGDDVHVSIVKKGGADVRVLDQLDDVLTVDVGSFSVQQDAPAIAPGRERILSGTEKLIREFDPPLRSEIPFVPTDPVQLQRVVAGEDVLLFQKGEGLLYKGKAAEAVEVFTYFAKKETPLRALASYRLGEALYLLQRYGEALQAFRAGERLWPEYLSFSPGTTFYYADSVARMGDPASGRRMLVQLIARLADKTYAPLLLDRLADILARSGREKEAVTIYGTVAQNFAGSDAADHAALKLADRRLFSVGLQDYQSLIREYQDINGSSGDLSLRDDACFKAAFLESLYGQCETALDAIIRYETQYPQGKFATIAQGMREELILLVYRERYEAKDHEGVVSLAQQNRDYLSRCFTDDLFIHRLSDGFAEIRKPAAEVAMFNYLIERDWAASAAPFMYCRIIDDALALADLRMAEAAARSFLVRFPRHPDAHHVLEQLGEISFYKKDMPSVAAELSWLCKPGADAGSMNSYYYLGKALETLRDQKGAERALTRFVDGVRLGGIASPLAGDAYFTIGSGRKGRKDYRGAMAVYRAGLENAGSEMRDQFLYAMGELDMHLKNYREAKALWGRIVKEGSDPVWRKMAQQSLSDLEWQENNDKTFSPTSK